MRVEMGLRRQAEEMADAAVLVVVVVAVEVAASVAAAATEVEDAQAALGDRKESTIAMSIKILDTCRCFVIRPT